MHNFALVDIDMYSESITGSLDIHGIMYCTRYSVANTIKKFAMNNGGLGITLEMSGMNTSDMKFCDLVTDVKFLTDVISVVQEVKDNLHTDGISKKNMLHEVKTPVTGHVKVNRKPVIEPGEVLFTVTDLIGDILYEEKADCHHTVLTLPDKYLYKAGETVFETIIK